MDDITLYVIFTGLFKISFTSSVNAHNESILLAPTTGYSYLQVTLQATDAMIQTRYDGSIAPVLPMEKESNLYCTKDACIYV